eukprot:2835637-Amphidinium_carterae.1
MRVFESPCKQTAYFEPTETSAYGCDPWGFNRLRHFPSSFGLFGIPGRGGVERAEEEVAALVVDNGS